MIVPSQLIKMMTFPWHPTFTGSVQSVQATPSSPGLSRWVRWSNYSPPHSRSSGPVDPVFCVSQRDQPPSSLATNFSWENSWRKPLLVAVWCFWRYFFGSDFSCIFLMGFPEKSNILNLWHGLWSSTNTGVVRFWTLHFFLVFSQSGLYPKTICVPKRTTWMTLGPPFVETNSGRENIEVWTSNAFSGVLKSWGIPSRHCLVVSIPVVMA